MEKQHIVDLFYSIIKEERTSIDINKMLHRLDINYTNEIIDMMFSHFIKDSMLFHNKGFRALLNVLVEEKYYREKLINLLNNKKYKIYNIPLVDLLVENLKIDNKEFFLKILNNVQFQNINFFLLNYEYFDYTDEEKRFLRSFLDKQSKECRYNLFFYEENELEKIKDKIGIFQQILYIDIYQKVDKNFNNKFDFFVNNFKYLDKNNENMMFLMGIFFSKIYFNINNLNEKLYIHFFKVNVELQEYFYNFLKSLIEKLKLNENEEFSKKIKKIISFTEQIFVSLKIENF